MGQYLLFQLETDVYGEGNKDRLSLVPNFMLVVEFSKRGCDELRRESNECAVFLPEDISN